MGRPPGPDDRGQSTVELALALPAVVLVVLFVVQVAVVARTQLQVTHAAREGARAAAVGEDPTAAVVASSGLDLRRVTVDRTGGDRPGDLVTVTVRFEAPTVVPLVGGLIDDIDLDASATMRVEG